MSDSQMTRTSLLIRLGNAQDSEVCNQFVEICSLFVYRYMRRQGLQDADAADVTQEVQRSLPRFWYS